MSNKDDLHLLYNVSAQDIVFFKQQQWRITNYALAIYAAIFAIAAIPHDWSISCVEKFLLGLIAIITAIATGVLVWHLREAIEVRRCRLKCVREHKLISDEFRECWRAKEKRDDQHVPLLLYSAITSGLLVILWLLWCKV